MFRHAPQRTKAPRRHHRPYVFSFLCSSSSTPVQQSRLATLLNARLPVVSVASSLLPPQVTLRPRRHGSVVPMSKLPGSPRATPADTLIDCVLCLYLRLLAMALEPVSRLMFVSLSSLDELLASRYLYWSCQGCPSALLRCWSNFLPVFSRSRPNPMILIPAVIVRYVFPLAVSALSPACLRDSDRARVVFLVPVYCT